MRPRWLTWPSPGPCQFRIRASLDADQGPRISAEFRMGGLQKILPHQRYFKRRPESPGETCVARRVRGHQLARQSAHIPIRKIELDHFRDVEGRLNPRFML